MVIAHRGASGTCVENSLDAFRVAAELGADGIELDVHATADGAIVVHHDPALPGLGPISRLTLPKALKYRLPNGEPLPTLEEALAVAPHLEWWIEVKALAPEADLALLEVIRRSSDPSRCRVHSFDHRIVARLRNLEPSLSVGILSVARLLDPARVLAETGADVLWQERSLVDGSLVEEVHRAGGRIIAWTVNDPAEAATLAGLGVDGLCGNWPDRLRPA